MAHKKGPGCAGCLLTLVLLVALIAGMWTWAMPFSLQNVVLAYGRHALQSLNIALPGLEASGTEGLGYEGQRLSGHLQDVYLQMFDGICSREESFAVFEATADDIDPAYQALMHDHPELFWLDGSCSYTFGLADVVTLEPGFSLPLSHVDSVQAQIDAQTNAFFQTVPAGASDYAVAKAAYEYVITTTDYVPAANQNQNIQSVFLGHASVCAGYARSLQYLLHLADIDCLYVEGTIDGTGEDHAWCIARLDGIWTNIDPTWGDPAYTGMTDQVATDEIVYDYLCLTTAELRRDRHTYRALDTLPPCDTATLDYYRQAGLFFESYDVAALNDTLDRQAAAGSTALFKFGDADAFRQATDALAAGEFCREGLLRIAENAQVDTLRYSYTANDQLYILKLYW